MRDGCEPSTTTNIVLVITPLNSIMMDQCKKLTERGLRACALDFHANSAWCVSDEMDEFDFDFGIESTGQLTTEVTLDDIHKYNIIYAHPESLISSRQGRVLLQRIKKRVCAVAVDEAHMILEWCVIGQIHGYIKNIL
jgi:superfamily II DNA helicase RecQ